MNASDRTTHDAIVIGGNIAGLATAYQVAHYGYRTRLIERGPQLGGVDASFANKNGRVFDFGSHALDWMRSEFTTRLFTHILDGACHRLERRRALVIRGHLIPHSAPVSEWPEDIRAMFPDGEIVDELGSDPTTFENLSKYYGEEFTRIIFEDVLPSYPSELIHTQHGVEPSKLMATLYPWFFPRARRAAAAADKSREFQDKMLAAKKEYLLYPSEGGFGMFASKWGEKLRAMGVEVTTGATDIAYDIDESTDSITAIRTGGETLTAPRIFWAAPATALLALLGREAPDLQPDRFFLGSMELEHTVNCAFTELLVADRNHMINRVSFPGAFARAQNNLVQLEFAVPRDDDRVKDAPEAWRDRWLESMRALGVIQHDNQLRDFDLKTVPMMYNSYGMKGERLGDVDLSDLHADSNLRPVLPTFRRVNINTRVPMYQHFVARELTGIS
jgi:protoporphyrinogen oxidase